MKCPNFIPILLNYYKSFAIFVLRIRVRSCPPVSPCLRVGKRYARDKKRGRLQTVSHRYAGLCSQHEPLFGIRQAFIIINKPNRYYKQRWRQQQQQRLDRAAKDRDGRPVRSDRVHYSRLCAQLTLLPHRALRSRRVCALLLRPVQTGRAPPKAVPTHDEHDHCGDGGHVARRVRMSS